MVGSGGSAGADQHRDDGSRRQRRRRRTTRRSTPFGWSTAPSRRTLSAVSIALLATLAVVAGPLTAVTPAVAQTDGPSIDAAVEYGDDGRVQVVFDTAVERADADGGPLTAANVTLVVDGDRVRPTSVQPDGRPTPSVGDAYTITHGGGDLAPTRSVSVEVDAVQTQSSNRIARNLSASVDVTEATVTRGGAHGSEDDPLTVVAGEGLAVRTDGTEGSETSLTVRNADSGDLVLSSVAPPSNGTILYVAADRFASGENYEITFGDGSTQYVTVTDLGLDVSVDDRRLTTEERLTATVRTDVADRDVQVAVVAENGTAIETRSLRTTGNDDIDFGRIRSVGRYAVQVRDTRLGNGAVSGIVSVSKPAEAVVSFDIGGQNTLSDGVGDVLRVPVDVTGTKRATLQIGDRSDGYWVVAHLTDGNEDGSVDVDFDTSLAGDRDDAVLRTTDGGDSLTIVERGGFRASEDDDAIDAGTYRLNASVGHRGAFAGPAGAVASLSLTDAGVTDMTIRRASVGSGIESWDAERLRDEKFTSVTRAHTFVPDEHLVVEVRAPGLEGELQGHSDPATRLVEVTNLSIEELDPDQDEARTEIALDGPAVSLIADSARDRYYLVVDTRRVLTPTGSINADDTYEIGVDGRDDERFTTTVDTTAASVDLPTDDDGTVVFDQRNGHPIPIRTSLAPGTTIQLEIRSNDDLAPFFAEPSATVRPTGRVVPRINVGDLATGTNMTVSVTGPDPVAGTSAPAKMASGASARLSLTDQPIDGSLVHLGYASLPEEGFIALHLASPDGPVVGHTDLLSAGTHTGTAITVSHRFESPTRLVAVVHENGDDSLAFEATADPPIREDGDLVTATAIIRPETTVTDDGTPTPTATATATQGTATSPASATDTEDPDAAGVGDGASATDDAEALGGGAPTPNGDSGPGLSGVVTIAAVLGAALIAKHRLGW